MEICLLVIFQTSEVVKGLMVGCLFYNEDDEEILRMLLKKKYNVCAMRESRKSIQKMYSTKCIVPY